MDYIKTTNNTDFYITSMFSEVYSGIPKAKQGNFKSWHERTRQIKSSLDDMKASYDAELAKMADTWAQKVIDERRVKYANDYQKAVKEAQGRILEDFENVIKTKRAKFSESNGAPSSDMINLLTALDMRAHLSAGDIAAAVPHLVSSLQALNVLRDLAHEHKVGFPHLTTQEEFDSYCNELRLFAEDMAAGIDNPSTYTQIQFYSTDFMGAHNGAIMQEIADKMDQAAFLQIDTGEIKPVKVENTSVTEEKPSQDKITRLTLDGSEYISTVARQFGTTTEAIQELNPGVDLIHTFSGQEILIPGVLKHPESGTGHISEDSHNMTVEVEDA